MLKSIKISVFLLLFLPIFSFGQITSVQDITERIKGYEKNNGEKLFIHTDRQTYFFGENIWFKIYDLDIKSHRTIKQNKVVYIELIDQTKSPVLQAKVGLLDGLGSSSIYLPSNLSSGNYLLRAYTSSMLNGSDPIVYEKTITLLNIKDGPNIGGRSVPVKYDLQFFPEGGDVIEGVPTKIAFKLTNSFGVGVDFEGFIVDEEENIIREIKTLKFGIGNTNFAPIEGKKYKVKIYLKDGQIINGNFPIIHKSGYTLNVTKLADNNLKVRVLASKDLNGRQAYIVVHSKNGEVKFSATLTVKVNQPIDLFVDENKLEEGISQITLFDHQQRPVAERLYFKRPQPQIKLSVVNNKPIYNPRSKVELTLTSTGKDLQSNLSVSVYKLDSMGYGNDIDISTYLWLSSELKGNVENIGYYFNNNSSESNEALDNLLLTHGWRRFKYEEYPKEEGTQPIVNYYGQLIQGRVKSLKGIPIKGVLTYLSLPGKNNRLYTGVTDDKGIVNFDVKNYYGSGDLIFQTDDAKRAEYELEILSPFYKKTSSTILYNINANLLNKNAYLDHSIAVQVENSFIPKGKDNFTIPKLDSIPFYSKADKIFNLDDYTRFRTMEEVIREYISSTALRKTGDKYHLHLLDVNRGYYFDKEPLILFDGVPTFNTNKIVSYDPLKVKSIELVYKRYYYGPLIADGVISFKTNSADAPELDLDSKSLVSSYDGLQATREFYSPVYELQEQINSRMPDFRTTLYWAPELITNKDGNVAIKFYTSDRTGDFKIIVNGISENGTAVSYFTDFKVNK